MMYKGRLASRNAFWRTGLLGCSLTIVGLSGCSDVTTGGGVENEAPPEELGESTTGLSGSGAVVRGTIRTLFPGVVDGGGLVTVPNVNVYLKNDTTGTQTGTIATDPDGNYSFLRLPAGLTQICWTSTQFVSGCGNRFTVVADKLTYAPDQTVSVDATKGRVYGKVALSDGTPARVVNAQFGANINTTAKAMSGSTQVGVAATANSRGYYVIGGLPFGTYTVTATNGSGTAGTTSVSSAATLSSGTPSQTLTQSLPNRRPVISSVVAYKNGAGIRSAAPGSTIQVKVNASDPDGDPLSYYWLSDAATNTCTVNQQTQQATCTLPSSTATHGFLVRVADGRGQYAFRTVQVAAGPAEAFFSGKIVDLSGNAVSGATVTINGVSTTENGAFSRKVPESNSYVLTVKKVGYETFSRPLQGGWSGAVVKLKPVPVTTFNPTTTNTLNAYNSRGTLVGTLNIPANYLQVESTGLPVSGMVSGYFSVIDRTDSYGRMPGDFSATDSGGNPTTLTSYGAAEINLFDSAGAKVNLRPGNAATLTLPVATAQQASAPATIPLWYYTESTALWTQDPGNGTYNTTTKQYTASLPHFSVANLDTKATTLDCIKVNVDTKTLSLPRVVRLTVSNGSGQVTIKQATFTDQINLINRLPTGTNVQIEVLADDGVTLIPGATLNVLTGTGQTPVINPPYPYDGVTCSRTVTLTGTPEKPGDFLNRFPNSTVEATNYYNKLGFPSTLTLGQWKIDNGFNTGDDAKAFYLNHGDLGFGRSMHMKNSGGKRAFYVSNYKTADEAAADTTGTDKSKIATVAMELSPAPGGGPNIIKFLVFDDQDLLTTSADLDQEGQKAVPGLCVSCHGGSKYDGDPSWNGDTGSVFLPFDLQPEASVMPSSKPGDPLSRQGQEADFRKMNLAIAQMPYVTQGSVDAAVGVTNLVQQWYGGTTDATATATQNDQAVPGSWQSTAYGDQSTAYRSVVATSCRSCHITRLDKNWDDFAKFKQQELAVDGDVCEARSMPHAKQTWNNFWLASSPARSTQLSTLLTTMGVMNSCP